MMTESLALTSIRIDGGTQPRAAISQMTVTDYAGCLSSGIALPPPDVFFDGVDYWLADGFHRFFAAKQIEQPYLTATIHTGTKRDAVLFSVGANHGHGLQRTNADKQKAVMTLLNDSEWGGWANAEIARRCGVDSSTVDKWRGRSLPDSGSEEQAPAPRTYTTKHGTDATMKVGKIGRSKPPSPDRSEAAAAQRHRQMREMAANDHTSRQIAAALELTEAGCRQILREQHIEVPADRAVGRVNRHHANRIVERMVMDAENLTADVNLIEFRELDRDRIGGWADSLTASRKALDIFIRRLMKEQQKHGEAA